MTEEYQKKYRWRRTRLDKHDPPTDNDFMGYDGEQSFARIQLDQTSHTKIGFWKWNITQIPWVRARVTPHSGWAETTLDAARQAEELYDRIKEMHGR